MHTITISATGETFKLPDRAYLSDAAELQLTGLVFGCRAGACGICAIEVTEGVANLSERDEMEAIFLSSLGYEQVAHRLACQCRLYGDITIKQM